MVPHLTAKKAPISLVSCTRVLGLGVHSCDGAALSGWVYIQYDALDRLLFDSDMRHGTLLGRCSTQSGARHRRATIGLYRLNMRQFGLRRLIISAARACGAQLIGFFHSNMRHLGLRRLIISAARATGAHTIGFFRIDMRHFGMVARIVVRANHTNSATFDGRNNYRSKRRPNAPHQLRRTDKAVWRLGCFRVSKSHRSCSTRSGVSWMRLLADVFIVRHPLSSAGSASSAGLIDGTFSRIRATTIANRAYVWCVRGRHRRCSVRVYVMARFPASQPRSFPSGKSDACAARNGLSLGG